MSGAKPAAGKPAGARRSLWLTVAGVLVYLAAGTAGDLLLKHGMGQASAPADVTPGEVLRLLGHVFTTPEVGLGVFLLATNFAMLLAVLTSADISVVGPARALGYLFLTTMAVLVLQEQVPPMRWAGVLLITLGVGLVLSTHEVPEEAPGVQGPEPGEPRSAACVEPRRRAA
jgi:multidrug transporter EmrE-like cation transporter